MAQGFRATSLSEDSRCASHSSNPNVMNLSVSAKDSLFHICAATKKRLEGLPQLQPYLNLAYSSSELLSEKQSLLLSQRQQEQQQREQRHVDSFQSVNNRLRDSSYNQQQTLQRQSSISTTSSKDDISALDGMTFTSNTSNRPTSNTAEEATVTFSMGILPVTFGSDPVTQLSQLFQQGSPLCIIFNAIHPQEKLPVVSSDDLKICKKSIYDFILGCREKLSLSDDELFTISDVFSNSTNSLLKVLDLVNTLLDLKPEVFPSMSIAQEKWLEEEKALQKDSSYTEYDKIMEEFVATERKYVNDLEILDKYRTQLFDGNLVTSEDLYILFPNLTEAIDFQRRFLISLEINALAVPSKQRLGALFAHSKHFFKLYEPWSIGQSEAIDFLSTNLEKVKPSNLIIGNKLELQSFLYKPIQRLCRYPLLLKELLQNAPENNSKEIEIALHVAKDIAKNINENQRRTENHKVMKQLYSRVVNWKGYRITKFGELLHFDKVFISTNNSSETEKEFEVYLFEKIIILFSEVTSKKPNSLSLKKKQSMTNSSLSLNLTNSHSGNLKHTNSGLSVPKLDLRGRIMIINLNHIKAVNTHSLHITWESPKEQGNFILKFKNEETRDNWCSTLQSLVRRVRAESIKSVKSQGRTSSISSLSSPQQNKDSHSSILSTNSLQGKRLSELLPKTRQPSISKEFRTLSENLKNSLSDESLLIRISYNSDFYTIVLPIQTSVEKVLQSISQKLRPFGTVSKVKYQDEDGDYVILESEDDWLVAKDMLAETSDNILNVWAFG